MAITQKPRVRVPATAKVGEVVEIKTLISHVMETGQRRDANGTLVPRNIINTFTATFNGRDVFRAALQPGISANPFISFFLKVPASGELVMTWTEDGGATMVDKARIEAT